MVENDKDDHTTSDFYQLKIGNTFNEINSSLYNTIKFDFKPASCNSAKKAHLLCQGGDSVVVAIPNDECDYTFFKGGKKPSTKDCILIIDEKTKVATLERVSHNFALKRTKISDDCIIKSLPPLKKNIPESTNKENKITQPKTRTHHIKNDLINDLMISESDEDDQ